ncbi:uncharacterized protein [Ptychodera flava]|uniref:uncharacterized protein n=1 Tax=Ptychodera flava TaxID=63121 RepID=UPI00396A0F5A
MFHVYKRFHILMLILVSMICLLLYEAFQEVHHRFFRPCIVANVTFPRIDVKYAARDTSLLCTAEAYPDIFRLETEGRQVLQGIACTQNKFIVKAEYFNGTQCSCQPWVDMHGRMLGPNSAVYPGLGKYNLHFNAVNIDYLKKGLFQVTIPPLDAGAYWLELSVVHNFDALGSMYSTETFTNPKCIKCIDASVTATPIKIILIDSGLCSSAPTPLCSEGNEAGRWMTVPHTGCDGNLCEGDINALASSGRVWVPYHCHYRIFSALELKRCTQNKKILLLGESILQEIAHDMMQLNMYATELPGIGKMVIEGAIINQRVREWRQVWNNGADILMHSIMTFPLGCGISCVTDVSNEELQAKLLLNGKVDLLLVSAGMHDIAPIERTTPKFYDVFAKYDQLLPIFIEKIVQLVKENGQIIWILPPDPSDKSRCDYLSRPRLQTVSEITMRHLHHYPEIVLLDYFQVSKDCYCGNIHKGCRFFHSIEADQWYNGFISRMFTHIILNRYCKT